MGVVVVVVVVVAAAAAAAAKYPFYERWKGIIINTSIIFMFQPTRFTAGLLCRPHCLWILNHWFWLHIS